MGVLDRGSVRLRHGAPPRRLSRFDDAATAYEAAAELERSAGFRPRCSATTRNLGDSVLTELAHAAPRPLRSRAGSPRPLATSPGNSGFDVGLRSFGRRWRAW